MLVEQYLAIATGPLGAPMAEGERAGDGERERMARTGARSVAEGLLRAHLARTGKADWCDKSLSNVFHLDRLAEVWPEARFVLLHRHCMDMVLSGIEASPWGLSEYGFGTVAQRSPTDTVVALAAYWADRTARMLDFERRQGSRCLRLRYEDLVAEPAVELARLWDHLGVEPVEPPEGSFGAPGAAAGPGDHTIWYTDRLHGEAVGRGARVPPDHVLGPLRAHVNELLEALDYPLVDDAWGSGEPGDGEAGPDEVELRLVAGHEVRARRVVRLGEARAAGDHGGGVVAIETDTVETVASGRRNLGAALRARQVRYYGPPLGDFDAERRVLGAVRAFLAEHLGELVAEIRSAEGN